MRPRSEVISRGSCAECGRPRQLDVRRQMCAGCLSEQWDEVEISRERTTHRETARDAARRLIDWGGQEMVPWARRLRASFGLAPEEDTDELEFMGET